MVQIISGGLAARDGGLEEEIVFLFDKRHQVGVVVTRDHEYALPGVFRRVRMRQDVEQPTRLDGDHNAFERNSPLRPEGLVWSIDAPATALQTEPEFDAGEFHVA